MKSIYYLLAVIIAALTIFFIANNNKPTITTGHLLPEAKSMQGRLDFINDDNKTNKLENIITNKWALLYFGYTNCTNICPVEMAIINQAVNKMKYANELTVIFVSIDPKRDIGKLNQYAKQFNKNFIGLSAKNDNLAKISKIFGIYYEYESAKERTKIDHSNHDNTYDVNHTSSFILLDKNTNYTAIFTTPYNTNKLAQSLDAIIRSL